MGYRTQDNYDKMNYPQSPLGAFCEGVFVGTFGFMSSIGCLLVSLFCAFGIETSISWWIACAMSLAVGLWFGYSFVCECRQDKKF